MSDDRRHRDDVGPDAPTNGDGLEHVRDTHRDAHEGTELERVRDAHDDAWIARVRDVWTPEELSPTERRAFDARLEARIEAHQRRGWLRVPLWQPATAAVVAALALWLLNGAGSPGPEPQPMAHTPMSRPASLAAWELEILRAAEVRSEAAQREADDAILPDDYRALAGLLLEGGDIANGR